MPSLSDFLNPLPHIIGRVLHLKTLWIEMINLELKDAGGLFSLILLSYSWDIVRNKHRGRETRVQNFQETYCFACTGTFKARALFICYPP